MVSSLQQLKTSTKTKVAKVLDNLSQSTLLDLFYKHLNYDRVDGASQSISTRQWDDNIKDRIADTAPVVLASGAGGAFQVIYTRLKSEHLSNKQEQRKIIEKLLPDRPYSLFVFANSSQSQWHFVNVKNQESITRRRLFRRIAVTKGEVNRTAIEQISELDLKRLGENLSALSAMKIQEHHDRAFDVEAVTTKFFTEYDRVFKLVEQSIEGIPNDVNRRLFTQKLFNRLMFVTFIQKKGWLKFGDSIDYLNALWQDYKGEDSKTGNFYRDRLSHLFFSGLNNQQQHDIAGINGGGFLKKIIGTVPYLNGGLFEQDQDEKNDKISVPDSSIKLIFDELFDRFNFTVTESTPLDEEVAVDPEMLGKTFEELVTGRHDSGSYYTPRPIVSFMCKEAIKGYLRSKSLSSNSTTNDKSEEDEISKFVDDRDASGLRDPELIFKALKEVTVCDPACGSGAYLLGMLHELLELRECLFTSKNLGSQTIYDRKLEIIENNLYGVDKELFAVSIARLRLWLSLAVDFGGAEPKPLPNLKYKLEVGDSLLAPVVMGTGLMRDEWVKQYRDLKAKYIITHNSNQKKELEKEIEAVKANIAVLTHGGSNSHQGFDWVVEFAEVMADGGFDIQVANPPYVRHERIQDFKPQLKRVYPDIYNGTSDLYCYFYARSLQLLKLGGMLAFISSNKWFRAGYGEKLRKHIADTCQIHSITDFGDLPVFKSATAYPMIFICSTQKPDHEETIFTQVKSLEYPYPNIREVIQEGGASLPSDAISGGNWLLADSNNSNRIKQMESRGIPLGKYVKEEIFYGIKTGLTQAFVVNSETRNKLISEDPASEEIIKPLVVGKGISKWQIKGQDSWLIVTKIGVNITRYPAIFKHLQQWQSQLERRCDKGNHWWELRPCAYYAAFDRPKIIYQKFQVKPCFTYDVQNHYINDSVWTIPLEDLYLLGVLNSKPFWGEISRHCTPIQNGYQLIWKYLQKAIIPNASETERKAISKLVQKCLDAKGVGCEAWEQEIDVRVAKLHGFEENYDLN
jgi:Eco57I restriction-modification methylase/TaqI-like C-terminal specificity domain